MLQTAEGSANRARAEAVQARAQELAASLFQQAIVKLADGNRLRTGQKPDSIRAFWAATDFFGQAAAMASAPTAEQQADQVRRTRKPPMHAAANRRPQMPAGATRKRRTLAV